MAANRDPVYAWLKCSTGSVPRAINNVRPNHFKSALGGATYMCNLLRAYATYRPGAQRTDNDTANDTANKGMPPGPHNINPKSQGSRMTEQIMISSQLRL